MQALLDAQPPLNIVHVFSSRKAAYGLTRAAERDVPTSVLALKPYLLAHPGQTREDYDAALAELVVQQQPDVIVLAGWMHILSDAFLDRILALSASEEAPTTSKESALAKIPLINLHPALPGAFDGANAIARAYEAFQRGEIEHTGVMVHEVVRDVDRGRPILTRKVEMVKGESVEALEARMHEVEHKLIVEATQLLVDDIKAKRTSQRSSEQGKDSLSALAALQLHEQ